MLSTPTPSGDRDREGRRSPVGAVKQSMHNENVCGPIAKDEATCNADLRCAYNKAVKTCKASIFYLVHTLDSGGCTTGARYGQAGHNVDVAQANAISTSGAASFSSFAVVVAALVAALSHRVIDTVIDTGGTLSKRGFRPPCCLFFVCFSF